MNGYLPDSSDVMVTIQKLRGETWVWIYPATEEGLADLANAAGRYAKNPHLNFSPSDLTRVTFQAWKAIKKGQCHEA